MSDFYRKKYERGQFGNKHLLAHLRTLCEAGMVMEHISTDLQLVMVISEEDDPSLGRVLGMITSAAQSSIPQTMI